VRDEIEQYRKANVQPLGINPGSLESHRRYVEKFKFPFPLLVDTGREMAKAYGAVKLGGMAIQRSVVLVGQDGQVRFAKNGAPGPAESLAGL
jgi:thioredoxin-dependent peroxiredoxin